MFGAFAGIALVSTTTTAALNYTNNKAVGVLSGCVSAIALCLLMSILFLKNAQR